LDCFARLVFEQCLLLSFVPLPRKSKSTFPIFLISTPKDHDQDLKSSSTNPIPEDIVIHQASEFLPTEKSNLELPLMSNSGKIRSHNYENIQTNFNLKVTL